jgi:hypothetical protein
MRLRFLHVLSISTLVLASAPHLSAQNLLIIWDNDSNFASTLSLKSALVAAGYSVSMSATDEDSWDNTNPPLTAFDGVIRMNGSTYTNEMPTAGQRPLPSLK